MKLIPLSKNGKNKGMYFAKVDDEDYGLLSKMNWHIHRPKNNLLYANCLIDRVPIKMHRYIVGVTDPKIFIDHINHDGLDNRRCNLRIATNRENTMNKRKFKKCTSIFRGVSRHKKSWVAVIRVNGVLKNLGYFKNEVDAAIAFDKKAIEVHGKFANLNFPDKAA